MIWLDYSTCSSLLSTKDQPMETLHIFLASEAKPLNTDVSPANHKKVLERSENDKAEVVEEVRDIYRKFRT